MTVLQDLAIVTLIVAVIFILWYLFITSCLWTCLAKSPTFILLFSQAINDVYVYALTQSLWHSVGWNQEWSYK
ncbi:hypothetical protein L596_021894 [Steinernema carpocapsae]|uniref:Uncharacterized protein n=1 Tax=Steinernema carpocapsae TaxID=34508 RepID=A0A4U5MK45_STECR|nr:hypothetical protein L596_021894 [Steinernema carpocapsae]